MWMLTMLRCYQRLCWLGLFAAVVASNSATGEASQPDAFQALSSAAPGSVHGRHLQQQPAPPPDGPLPPASPPPPPPSGPLIPVDCELKVLSGDLCITPAPAAANACAQLNSSNSVILTGSINASALGGSLSIGTAMFRSRRAVQWAFSSSTQLFVADISVNSTLTVVLWNITTGQARPDRVESQLTGLMRLSSSSYPGPGFTGSYNWSGSLMFDPDPWQYYSTQLGSADATAAGPRRALLSGAEPIIVTGSAPVASNWQEDRVAPIRQSDVAPGQNQCSPADQAAGFCAEHGREELSSSSSSPLGSRAGTQVSRRLLATSAAAVTGKLSALETGSTIVTAADDAKRNDNATWLDGAGSIRIVGAVPADLVPDWKQASSSSSGSGAGGSSGGGMDSRLVYILAGVLGGVALLGVVVAVVVVVVRKRKAAGKAAAAAAPGEQAFVPSRNSWVDPSQQRATSPRQVEPQFGHAGAKGGPRTPHVRGAPGLQGGGGWTR